MQNTASNLIDLLIIRMYIQITLWLQGLFLFSLVWTVGGTIDGNSRVKFDAYFRTLISGTDNENPKPKTSKLSKSNVFPERGAYGLQFSIY